ncbi:MAG: NAD-dependent succinate-semialdehyde dehydrogenase [Bryobacteraceae bacterium]|nr:NAD-dependent succinate-semialdehyde dehydrogenase [Bryobacteraceae bacterium]
MPAAPLYLNGAWVETGSSRPICNPANGEPVGAISLGTRGHAARAIADAHTAFLAWRELPGKTRGQHLDRIAAFLEARKDAVARTITLENGKPLAQSAGETAMAVDHLRWFAEEAKRAYGRVVPNQVDGKRHLVIKSPMGVVGAISPWNFPLALAVRKIAPALAAGCTVVLKPATQTPLCAVAFAECVHEAGLPAGVFQLVVGPSAEIGAEFLSNPRCRKVTFTGSTEVGRQLIAGAAETVKPLSLELGGHAPVLVFDDAAVKRAVEGTMIAKFRNTGQSCIAANRIYVQNGIYDRFLQAFVERVKALKVGNGLEPGVEIGPLIDQAGLDKALEHVRDAVARGAKLLTGGERVPPHEGFFLSPAVLADVPDGAACMTEETFAPIAVLRRFATEQEAIEQANDSVYGLSAYVFTQSIDRAWRVIEKLDAGTIGLNDGLPTTSQCPFGGAKQSGWGRELGTEGMDAFLETKHIAMALDPQL